MSPRREVILFSVCRDELLRMPYFFAYYRALGVTRFHIISNDSTDGTNEFVERQGDARLVKIDASYASARCGQDWLDEALDKHGRDRWCVVADADEVFRHPEFESESLNGFIDKMEHEGASALHCVFLDMYSDRSIAQTRYAPGSDPLLTCPYFDRGSIYSAVPQENPSPKRPMFQGGVRERIFGIAPNLNKIPLLFVRPGTVLQKGAHGVSGDVSLSTSYRGAVLHFKYLHDFASRASMEVDRGEHHKNAIEYRDYTRGIAADPSLTFFGPESVRFEGTTQLVSLGLMKVGLANDHLVPTRVVLRRRHNGGGSL